MPQSPPGRTTVTIIENFDHSVEDIWAYVSQPELLSQWWPMTAEEIPPEVGATARFLNEDGSPAPGHITHFEVERVIGFADEGHVHEVKLELEPHGTGCHLTLTHTFPDDQPANQHEHGWNACLDELERLLGESVGE